MGDGTPIPSKRKYRAQRRKIRHFDAMSHIGAPIFSGIERKNLKYGKVAWFKTGQYVLFDL